MRVNYDQLAEHFDQGRRLLENGARLWANVFGEHLRLKRDARVLDIGCGTGRFATTIVQYHQCEVVGVDPSPGMLERAGGKCPNHAQWLLGRAEAIPLADGIFDAGLASQVVHHFENKQQAFDELYRVLRPGGRLGIRYSSHAQLSSFLDYRFFPSALSIDLARVPDLPVLKELLWNAGFCRIEEHVIYQQFFTSAGDYMHKLQHQYSSVLALIPREEYLQGLERAGRFLSDHELRPEEQFAPISFIVAIKPVPRFC